MAEVVPGTTYVSATAVGDVPGATEGVTFTGNECVTIQDEDSPTDTPDQNNCPVTGEDSTSTTTNCTTAMEEATPVDNISVANHTEPSSGQGSTLTVHDRTSEMEEGASTGSISFSSHSEPLTSGQCSAPTPNNGASAMEEETSAGIVSVDNHSDIYASGQSITSTEHASAMEVTSAGNISVSSHSEPCASGQCPTPATNIDTSAMEEETSAGNVSVANHSEDYESRQSITSTDHASAMPEVTDAPDHASVINGSESSQGSTYYVDDSGSTLSYPNPKWDRFVPADSLHRLDPKNVSGARLRDSIINNNEHMKQKDPTEVLGMLRTARDDEARRSIGQTLRTRSLPKLAEQKKMGVLSQFLTVSDASIQSLASQKLEIQLLQLGYSEDPSVTTELVMVAENTQKAFLHTSVDDSLARTLCYLHLISVSAVLSRCSRPEYEHCKSFVLSSKQKKQKPPSGSTQHTMLKLLQQLYETFKDELSKTTSFPVWAKMEADKRRARLQLRTNCCELNVYAYTLLNEIAQQAWSPCSLNLLENLRDLYRTSTSNKNAAEVKAVFDYLFVRGLVTLLQTTFKEGLPQVGEQHYQHTRQIAELIVEIIKGSSPEERKYLLKEVEPLPFHSSTYVRQTFNLLFRAEMRCLKDLSFSLMESTLHAVEFQREPSAGQGAEASVSTGAEPLTKKRKETSTIKGRESSATGAGESADQDECSWRKELCRLGGKLAEAVVYVPKASCMADGHLDKCISEHPWAKQQCPVLRQQLAEGSERHKRNMDYLKKLSPKCPNLLQLMAYQFKPFPFFITEPVENRRLLQYLLKHRGEQRWLDNTTLVHVTQEILKSLVFLARQGIAARDVTAYNMVVETVVDNCGDYLNTSCIIKLADLGLAHEFRSSTGIRPVRDQGDIPTRWTAPEAMFDGLYTEKSMVYSVACVIYEMWTHGCQPFTSYDTSKTTEEILIQMFGQPESVKLHHWPCIPYDVFTLIQRCTDSDPAQRPTLEDLQKELKGIGLEMEVEDPGLEEALCLENQYPVPSANQRQRNHKPETGIPVTIQRLIEAGKQSQLYTNTKKSQWMSMSNVAVTDQELSTSDWIVIEIKDDRTVVKEVVTAKFTHEVLPSVEASELPGVTWVPGDQGAAKRSATWQDGLLMHEREYPPCKDLQTASKKGLLWKTCHEEEQEDGTYDAVDVQETPKYLVVFTSLAESLAKLHEQGFCHRDVRAKNILIDCQNGQATLARIGRMCRMPSSRDSHHLVSDVFQDSYRWLAPEVLISGQYGPENDVFMLGTTMWEAFWTRQVALRDPAATVKSYAPCTDILKEQVLEFVREDTPLPMPYGMPKWLYELVLQCRHQDSAKRPAARTVWNTLKQHFTSDCVSEPFFEETNTEVMFDVNNADHISPAVPKRQKKPRINRNRRRTFLSRFTRGGKGQGSKRRRLTKEDILIVPNGEDTKPKSFSEAASPGQGSRRNGNGHFETNRSKNHYSLYKSKDVFRTLNNTVDDSAGPLSCEDTIVKRVHDDADESTKPKHRKDQGLPAISGLFHDENTKPGTQKHVQAATLDVTKEMHKRDVEAAKQKRPRAPSSMSRPSGRKHESGECNFLENRPRTVSSLDTGQTESAEHRSGPHVTQLQRHSTCTTADTGICEPPSWMFGVEQSKTPPSLRPLPSKPQGQNYLFPDLKSGTQLWQGSPIINFISNGIKRFHSPEEKAGEARGVARGLHNRNDCSVDDDLRDLDRCHWDPGTETEQDKSFVTKAEHENSPEFTSSASVDDDYRECASALPSNCASPVRRDKDDHSHTVDPDMESSQPADNDTQSDPSASSPFDGANRFEHRPGLANSTNTAKPATNQSVGTGNAAGSIRSLNQSDQQHSLSNVVNTSSAGDYEVYDDDLSRDTNVYNVYNEIDENNYEKYSTLMNPIEYESRDRYTSLSDSLILNWPPPRVVDSPVYQSGGSVQAESMSGELFV